RLIPPGQYPVMGMSCRRATGFGKLDVGSHATPSCNAFSHPPAVPRTLAVRDRTAVLSTASGCCRVAISIRVRGLAGSWPAAARCRPCRPALGAHPMTPVATPVRGPPGNLLRNPDAFSPNVPDQGLD